jgi:hypothetical protein
MAALAVGLIVSSPCSRIGGLDDNAAAPPTLASSGPAKTISAPITPVRSAQQRASTE